MTFQILAPRFLVVLSYFEQIMRLRTVWVIDVGTQWLLSVVQDGSDHIPTSKKQETQLI